MRIGDFQPEVFLRVSLLKTVETSFDKKRATMFGSLKIGNDLRDASDLVVLPWERHVEEQEKKNQRMKK